MSLAIASSDAEDEHEQYFTPPEISSFMASMFDFTGKDSIRILDAGSGTGILGIGATLKAYESGVEKVHLVCFETEKKSLELLTQFLVEINRTHSNFTSEVHDRDFLGHYDVGYFDYVISNPPYSKISPDIVHGGDSPNLYSRFMEVSSKLLNSNGQMVFIVPRSFTNGVYFERFRSYIFQKMSTTQIHIFHSRKDIFVQQVLQEIMIISIIKAKSRKWITVSSCTNRHDIEKRVNLKVPRKLIELGKGNTYRVAIPTSRKDVDLLKTFNSWKGRFNNYGIQISTGPVVGYRSKSFLLDKPKKIGSYPMIWPTHITLERVNWPKINSKKKQYIDHSAIKIVVPNENYVIIKRFTTKEEAKRLFTCPYEKQSLPGEFIGLGNKLNFIHMGEEKMSFLLCKGISFMLNTTPFDTYIRITNGQTQVNATDLVNIPIPDIQLIEALGKCKSENNDYTDAFQILLKKANEKN